MNNDILTLRKQLLANGYTPLPNVGKACFLKEWPAVSVDDDEIVTWGRRLSRFQDTGVRIDRELAVLDLDIDDVAIDEVEEALIAAEPALESALVRFGKGHKQAWFLRSSEPFKRYFTRRWLSPGTNADEKSCHSVECFGGASPRQFGAFGAHTRSPDGEVLISYEWSNGRSPATVPLRLLPKLERSDLSHLVDLTERVLEKTGFKPVTRSHKGVSEPTVAFDLTHQMHFECNDHYIRTLEELEKVATAGLRCSASWLEVGASNLERCLVGYSPRYRSVFVWESASGVTHFPEDCKPMTSRTLSAMMSTIVSPWTELVGATQ